MAHGLTAQRIWQDLREDYGYGHPYSSVKRFDRRAREDFESESLVEKFAAVIDMRF